MATDNKYDRQLRLWGANGQKALQEASVLLVGAGPAGTETMKNLVLPGIGRITVVDGETVGESDLANNFFVRPEDVGRPRAAVVCELLRELNPDVEGTHRVARPSELVTREPDFFSGGGFSLVVASQLEPTTLQQLGEICWQAGVPLIVCRAYGLIGSVRLQFRRLEIVESKPDSVQWDLRLAEPFPALQQLADALDLDALSDVEHAHVPYALVLVKLVNEWRAAHAGALPATRCEKDAFRATVAAAARELQSKVPEINMEEAEREAYRAWADPRQLPFEAEEVFRAALEAKTPPTTRLERMLSAAASFAREENGGKPPLAGPIPDMHADTFRFVALQQAYAAQAKADAAAVQKRYVAICEEQGVAWADDDAAALTTFCKHVRDIAVHSTRSLAEELASPDFEDAASALFETEDAVEKAQTPVLWYVALRAADRFFVKRGRWPGRDCEEDACDSSDGAASPSSPVATLAADAQALADEMRAFVSESGAAETFDGTLSDAHAREIARYGAAELHCIAAVVGGVASQEAVKIIAKQYAPINHTYIYNGIAATAAVMAI